MMSAIFYLVALIAALAFLHPYITYPLSLRLMKRRPIEARKGTRPSASLLFSAYNESASLPAKIANLEAIKKLYPDLEILAYSDKSSDDTLALLESRPDLLCVIAAPERTGKAMGMRKMVEIARGDVCIFTDANVILEPEAVGRLLDYFRAPDIGGVSGTLRYVNDGESATANVGGLYWQLEEKIKALETRCGSMMGADGSIFATRRSRYPEVPAHLLDDMIVSMNVLFQGGRLIAAGDVIAYERNTTRAGEEFRRKRRIACRAYNSHLYLRPDIVRYFGLADTYKYVSHKLLRWFGAPLMVLALLSFSIALVLDGKLGALALLWAAPGVVGAGALLGLRPCAMVMNITGAVLATFIGIIDAWNGCTYQTWAPAKSRA